MMRRHPNFIRIRVQEARRQPIDCMMYEIEPGVFWTRSLYHENSPQICHSLDEATEMMQLYVDEWTRQKYKSTKVDDASEPEDFFTCSPKRALLT